MFLVCFDVLQKQKVFLSIEWSACAMIGQLNVNVMKNTVHTINIISSEIHVTSNKWIKLSVSKMYFRLKL